MRKKTVKPSVFFALWGSGHVKAARKTLVKWNSEQQMKGADTNDHFWRHTSKTTSQMTLLIFWE